MGCELAQIALRIEDRISRAATETMEQQKTQILRINANEATLNAQLVQSIASFSENYLTADAPALADVREHVLSLRQMLLESGIDGERLWPWLFQ